MDTTSSQSEEELRRIYWRAATIDERLEAVDNYTAAGPVSGYMAVRLAKWAAQLELVGQTVDNRLCSAGLDRHVLAAVLSDDPPDSFDSREELERLRWLIACLTSGSQKNFECERNPLPFERALCGLVTACEEILRRSFQESPCDTLISDLSRSLMVRVTNIASSSLFDEFSVFKIVYSTQENNESYSQPSGSTLFDRFVSDLQSGGIVKIFSRRPVLAKLLLVAVFDWLDNSRLFLTRLSDDLEKISKAFFGGRVLDPVGLSAGLSDPHDGGQTVFKVRFKSGVAVAYKPRSLAVDLAMEAFLKWLQESAAPASYEVAQSISCGDYGWAEWIDPADCETQADLNAFFERAGATLCILQVLGAVDFHAENVIVRGERPYLIDLETVLHPISPGLSRHIGQNSATGKAASVLKNSVISTHYLPAWMVRGDNSLVRFGGLDPYYVVEPEHLTFAEVNTDGMHPINQAPPKRFSANRPTLRGCEVNSATGTETIKAGYGAMYNFILRRRDQLLVEDGPLKSFKKVLTRVVIRPTSFYGLVIQKSLRSDRLSNGFDWSLAFEQLPLLHNEITESEQHTITSSERRSLARLDVPLFISSPDSRHIEGSGGIEVPNYYSESSLSRQVNQIRALSIADCKRQKAIIDWSFDWEAPDGKGRSREAEGQTQERLGQDRAIELCHGLASTLLTSGIYFESQLTWIGSVPIQQGHHTGQLEVVGPGLYSGNAGIAIFFSALFHVTKDVVFYEAAISAISSIERDLTPRNRSLMLGGGAGIGSIIYGLVKCSNLLGNQEMLRIASRIVQGIVDINIPDDKYFDVMLGSAGLLLGVLELQKVHPCDENLRVALDCGKHLVKNQLRGGKDEGAWPPTSRSTSALGGISHGSIGIAMALAKLAHYAPFCDGAIEAAVSHQRSLYLPTANNWRDMRLADNEDNGQSAAWCHGAAGVGMAHLALLQSGTRYGSLTDVKIAVEAIGRAGFSGVDDLCCGAFGQIELLFTAGNMLKRPDLNARANALALSRIERSVENKTFKWRVGRNEQNPGLFTGIAGVGYQLLRLSGVNLPSILMWE